MSVQTPQRYAHSRHIFFFLLSLDGLITFLVSLWAVLKKDRKENKVPPTGPYISSSPASLFLYLFAGEGNLMDRLSQSERAEMAEVVPRHQRSANA
jgi:hypothetical protein